MSKSDPALSDTTPSDNGEHSASGGHVKEFGGDVLPLRGAGAEHRADTQVRPYGYMRIKRFGWVGADLCVCP